jgi:hypothetical protein
MNAERKLVELTDHASRTANVVDRLDIFSEILAIQENLNRVHSPREAGFVDMLSSLMDEIDPGMPGG